MTHEGDRWKIFGLAIVASLASLCILELGARTLGDFPTSAEFAQREGRPGIAARSPYLPFTLPKGKKVRREVGGITIPYSMNEHGYRGTAPRTIKKPRHLTRILIVGDSFTFGWGSRQYETFVQQIQDALDPDRYEVINAGYHAGYSPDSYYAYLVREAPRLAPNVLVVVLFSGNDVEDVSTNIWLATDEHGGPTRLMTTRLLHDWQGKPIHSAETLRPFWPWNYHVSILSGSHAFIGLTSHLNRALGVPDLTERLEREARKQREDAWERIEIAIRSIARWSSSHRVHLLFVTLPPKQGADADTRELDDLIERLELPLVEASSHLSYRNYLVNDGHFNRSGNTVVARLILDFLRREGWVASR